MVLIFKSNSSSIWTGVTLSTIVLHFSTIYNSFYLIVTCCEMWTPAEPVSLHHHPSTLPEEQPPVRLVTSLNSTHIHMILDASSASYHSFVNSCIGELTVSRWSACVSLKRHLIWHLQTSEKSFAQLVRASAPAMSWFQASQRVLAHHNTPN